MIDKVELDPTQVFTGQWTHLVACRGGHQIDDQQKSKARGRWRQSIGILGNLGGQSDFGGMRKR